MNALYVLTGCVAVNMGLCSNAVSRNRPLWYQLLQGFCLGFNFVNLLTLVLRTL